MCPIREDASKQLAMPFPQDRPYISAQLPSRQRGFFTPATFGDKVGHGSLTLGSVPFVFLHQPVSAQPCSLAGSKHWFSSCPTLAIPNLGPWMHTQTSPGTLCLWWRHRLCLPKVLLSDPVPAARISHPSPLASWVTGVVQPCFKEEHGEHQVLDRDIEQERELGAS